MGKLSADEANVTSAYTMLPLFPPRVNNRTPTSFERLHYTSSYELFSATQQQRSAPSLKQRRDQFSTQFSSRSTCRRNFATYMQRKCYVNWRDSAVKWLTWRENASLYACARALNILHGRNPTLRPGKTKKPLISQVRQATEASGALH